MIGDYVLAITRAEWWKLAVLLGAVTVLLAAMLLAEAFWVNLGLLVLVAVGVYGIVAVLFAVLIRRSRVVDGDTPDDS